jgi:hypothetical protein
VALLAPFALTLMAAGAASAATRAGMRIPGYTT